MRFQVLLLTLAVATTLTQTSNAADPPVKVGTFKQQIAEYSDVTQEFDSESVELPGNAERQLARHVGRSPVIRDVAAHNGRTTIAVAEESGLYVHDTTGWNRVFPSEGDRSWAVRDVRAVDFDDDGRLWFASPQGVGVLDGEWRLFDGSDGLPYNDFTAMAAGNDGTAWFATTKGAIFFDGEDFRYRQGLRWLPHDDVRDVRLAENGDAWFQTAGGVGVIRSVNMTLAAKAKYYEEEIDRYHRRTPYEYVLQVQLPAPGVKENVRQHDSDNDGLWTSMYGAGECFAFAATGDSKARERAMKAFRAMRFLATVTQGGEHTPSKGYVARTILPTSGPNPNDGRIERDRREQQEGDALWKVYEPRWPVSADGKWYWKSDTSSDELDGHYFLYGLYYDLVAETDDEKEAVRAQIRDLTDHLIRNGFNLVDHDGTPTRWARFSPEEMNFDHDWFAERGLNSLSMLSYLRTTAHITGEDYYHEVATRLIEDHGYAQNLMYPKFQRGVGTGNQSDDEMAIMGYYNIMKYEPDESLRERYAHSFWHYWRLEQPELNPFFNFAFASQCMDATYSDAWGVHDMSPVGDWLEESIDTLKRFPLDRIDWAHENSHRLDILPLPEWANAFDDQDRPWRGMRVNHRVLPVDERHFSHWNTDPFRLDQGGRGHELSDGAVFLLPYYMGLYHGFIEN